MSVPGRFLCQNSHGFVESGSHGPGVCNSSIMVPNNRDLISAGIPDSSVIKFGLSDGFEVKWNITGMNCTDCDNAGAYCGYSTESNKTVCYCPGGNFLIGTACPVYIIYTAALLPCIVKIVQRRRCISEKVSSFLGNKSQDDPKVEAFIQSYGSLCPQRYSYQDIKKMTNFFSNKLGQGGFGDVYKGQLRDGRLVAVKLLKQSKGDGEDFINEVASISTTSHVNVVTFLGFCFEKKKRALVYKFMPNGSLDKYLYDHELSTSIDRLGWNKMYPIALGIARGLEYLHRGCNTRIVHFDIKPHNILLDEDFCPKISDFGLSKQCIGKESNVSMLIGRGTPGYIAPEIFYRNFGHVSHKSDVYSYGMLIIEIAVGRKNMDARLSETSEIYFADWIYRYTEPGNLFELQGVVTEEEKEIAKKMILVSLWCIQAFPSDRPPMSKVVEMLEGEADNLQIPPKPSLSSPARSIRCSSQTSGLPSSSTSELRILCPSE